MCIVGEMGLWDSKIIRMPKYLTLFERYLVRFLECPHSHSEWLQVFFPVLYLINAEFRNSGFHYTIGQMFFIVFCAFLLLLIRNFFPREDVNTWRRTQEWCVVYYAFFIILEAHRLGNRNSLEFLYIIKYIFSGFPSAKIRLWIAITVALARKIHIISEFICQTKTFSVQKIRNN